MKQKKKCATAGFVLSIFRSASEDATPTPRDEKKFGVEFNYAHWALKSKNILNLCPLPQSSALWSFLFRNDFSWKCTWVTRLLFCQNDSPIGGSFWQKDSLITFRTMPIMIFSPIANLMHHPSRKQFCIFSWSDMMRLVEIVVTSVSLKLYPL